jgi:hypothetical protein
MAQIKGEALIKCEDSGGSRIFEGGGSYQGCHGQQIIYYCPQRAAPKIKNAILDGVIIKWGNLI